MNQTISSIDNPCALMVQTPNAADCPASLTEDAQRIYTALTERPADFEDFFTPARRGSLEATPTYHALTERPADVEDFFSPPRQFAQAEPTYKALTERPGEPPTDESTAPEVPPGIQHIAA